MNGVGQVVYRVQAVDCTSVHSDWVCSNVLQMPVSAGVQLEFEDPFDGGGVLHRIGTAGDTQPYRNPQSTGEVQSI